MILNALFGSLACLSFALLIWQWLVALRFPLHQRTGDKSFAPAVTLLKSLKGADAATEDCLRSWFTQDYAGEVQILFAAVSAEDPVCNIVRKLIQEFPKRDAQLVICSTLAGANAKVSKLAELEKLSKHEILAVSDADVRVRVDFLANAVTPLRAQEIGLVNCFYRLANPSTLAMQWEAIAINADFWSQVLQSQTLKPLDFALGAVMLTRGRHLAEIGGFKSLMNCLADDYQLGNRIASHGHRIVLSPIVVECWDPPMTWHSVWKHQLRWARTIRVSQPVPYFFSILSNAGLWSLLWLALSLLKAVQKTHVDLLPNGGFESDTPLGLGVTVAAAFCILRILAACSLQYRLTRSSENAAYFWLVPFKDLLQAAIWLCAFAGNRIEWRGQVYRLRRDGTLVKAGAEH